MIEWLGLLVHPRWREDILGDLEEEHRARVREGTPRGRSALRLGVEVIGAGLASRWQGMRGAPAGPATPYGNGTRGGVGMMEETIRDVRFAVRSLRRSPLFTAVALATLAAGVGLTLAVFAVVNGVLLRPLDYPEPDRLVLLQGQPGARYGVPMPAHVLFRDNSSLLEGAAAWQGWAPVMEDSDGAPVRRSGASVSADFFSLIGVTPAAGRLFTEADGAPGHEPVVVLGHDFWTTHFGADPAAVGTLLELDGEDHRVVGVMPAGFRDPVARVIGFSDRELWRAEPPTFREAEGDEGWVGFWSVGRIRPGADADALTREMRGLVRAHHGDASELERYLAELRAITVKDAVVEDVRSTLLVLLTAVGAVLLIACANLANLLLSRGTARSAELTVRTSLGAGRSRLLRQLLTESAVLALAGTGIGLLLARGGLSVLVSLAGPDLPRAEEVAVDGTVLLFALGAALGTALLFGVVPALRVTSRGTASSPAELSRGSTGARGGRLRKGLVVAETGLAMVLLSGAGLLLGTFLSLQSVDPGFDSRPMLTAYVGLPPERLPEPGLQGEALRSAEEALAALPGVDGVGAISDLPLSGAVNSTRIRRIDDSDEDAAARSHVLVRAVTPGYFEAMGIPWVRGRPLDRDARAGSEEVAAVNEEFVRRFFPSEDPVGELVDVRGVRRRIVGVVADVREFDLTSPDRDPALYTPYDQERAGWMRSGMTLVVRVAGDPTAFAGPARSAVAGADPGLLVGTVRPLDALLDAQLRIPRFRATLVLVFAGLALLLAAVGLGGVVAYGVSQRVPEIGLRLALGAERGQVLGMLLRETLLLTATGVVIGLGGALLTGRVLAGFLFQVAPRDPVVLGGAAVLLLGVGILAGWLPARRAARVDPSVALRGE